MLMITPFSISLLALYCIWVVGNVSQNNSLAGNFSSLGNYSYSYFGGKYDYKEQEFKDFYKRLKDKGKHTSTCMVAVARKIAVRTYFDLMRCHE